MGKDKPQFLVMILEKPFSKTNKVEFFFYGIFFWKSNNNTKKLNMF